MEEQFARVLDLLQEYLQLQADLEQSLRKGHLCMAQARYSMGVDRVSPLQLPAHMRGTYFLEDVQGHWQRGARASSTGRGSLAVAQRTPGTVGPGDAADGGSGREAAAAGDAVSVQERLAQLALEPGSIVQELAAKYGADDTQVERYSFEESDEEEVPLHWFGKLVPQALHGAEADFKAALELMIQAANTQRELNAALGEYMAKARDGERKSGG